ncbi:sensor domain-containing diguanylate cyclase [Thermobrachium celere]|uniref:Response regulator receiver modulated diguanylate cyclase with PAS/PAC sensor n=1 Tax=Thermobrachium celere DSM 8682 TaxID=941824 RepID=R7RN72_9CLOT|nr:sensor domain-containing diguanylate cyclase [Thermobrachium celere]CDF57484.1 response regulator receiver modulated diguanylate cyclase with PAS/PAC sensor [Thermobrachium celere DSM 8682]
MKPFIVLMFVLIVLALMVVANLYVRLKEKYEREVNLNNLLIEISKEFSVYKDVYKLYKKILVDTLKIIEEGDAGSILIYNREKDHMEYVAAIGYDIDELKKINLKKEELYLYKLNRLNSADIIKNPRAFDSEYIDNEKYNMLMEMEALNIKSVLSAPIYVDGEFYGIINIDNNSNVDAFSEKDIELIDFLVKQMEIAIKNAHLLDELKHTLRTDDLTGVYNRRYFEELLEKEIRRAQRYGNRFSLVLIDLDNFKPINDTFGHKKGDKVLKHFANILKCNLRDTDIVARLGGDEFVILLHGADENQAEGKMGFIKNCLVENTVDDLVIDFSYGICEYKDGLDIDKMITCADDKMYEQKKIKKIER